MPLVLGGHAPPYRRDRRRRRTCTTSAPSRWTTWAASSRLVPRVTVSSVITARSPGKHAGDAAARAVVLHFLSDAERARRRPRVAATPAVMKLTPSAPMVSPPIAVASLGIAASTSVARSSITSGAQIVCLGVDEPGRGLAGLEREVAAAHRMFEQVLASTRALASLTRAPRSPAGSHAPDHRGPDAVRSREGDRRLGRTRVQHDHHPESAVEDPHHLVGGDGSAPLNLEEDLGRLEARPSRSPLRARRAHIARDVADDAPTRDVRARRGRSRQVHGAAT